MRSLFKSLRKEEDVAPSILQQVLDGFAKGTVSDDIWQQCMRAKELEEPIDEALPLERLRELRGSRPEQVFGLSARCVETMEDSIEALSLSSDMERDEEREESLELALVNATMILTRILCAGPSRGTEVGAVVRVCPLFDMLWASGAGGKLVGPSMVEVAMCLLFLEDFAVESPNPKSDDEDDSSKSFGSVDASLLWREGVGPEGGGSIGKVDKEIQMNRQLGLQLLAAVICGGAPTVPPQGHTEAAEVSSELSRPLIADTRALDYLCDPANQVSRRTELLYSLLSVVLSYDPHGFGVPYAGYFSGKKEESFVQLCLQVLGLLLQGPQDVTDDAHHLSAFKPQRREGQPTPKPHIFRELLLEIKSERELAFLAKGVGDLFGAVGEEQSAYLPRSVHVPVFLPELLALLFHLSASNRFVAALCTSDEAPELCEHVLHAVRGFPGHLHDDPITLLTWGTLLRLTASRDLCIALNCDFEGSVPDDLPSFSGSVVDLVALAALDQAGHLLATAESSDLRGQAVDACLATLANLSTYAEGLCKETCSRIFSVIERIAKSLVLTSGTDLAISWLAMLLEVLANSLQYQYVGNETLAYGIMTRHKSFHNLFKFISKRSEGSDATGAKDDGRCDEHISGRVWTEMQASLVSICDLLDAVIPSLESEVQKQDISMSSEAKALMPKSLLGFLPPPHAFVVRTFVYDRSAHRACEYCLVACLANGPIAEIWDAGSEVGSNAGDARPEEKATSKDKVKQSKDFAPPSRQFVEGAASVETASAGPDIARAVAVAAATANGHDKQDNHAPDPKSVAKHQSPEKNSSEAEWEAVDEEDLDAEKDEDEEEEEEEEESDTEEESDDDEEETAEQQQHHVLRVAKRVVAGPMNVRKPAREGAKLQRSRKA